MIRYKNLREQMPFNEAFRKNDISRAVVLLASLIGKRIGTKINLSSMSGLYGKPEGEYIGVFGILDSGGAIKFNWKLGDSSGQIETIDYWKKESKDADITIDTDGMNAIKIIDTISDAILNGKPGDQYQELEERVNPKTKGTVSKEITNSINAYFKAFDLQTYDLENRRITSDVYNEFMFWYNELSDEDSIKYKFVPKPTFINYMKVYMDKNDIVNKFSRKVTVRKATKEVLKVNKSDENAFKNLYQMSLDDKMDLISMGVITVVKGYKQSALITGCLEESTDIDVLVDKNIYDKIIENREGL